MRHAVAIDERRRFYRTNLWTRKSKFPSAAHQDVRQVWFAGVHSDVGGSYPEAESGLSKISLAWMLKEVDDLDIDEEVRDRILPPADVDCIAAPDHKAKIHESLKGLWWILEVWLPFPLGRRRSIPPGALIHRSVEHRIRDVPAYKVKLPEGYVFVD